MSQPIDVLCAGIVVADHVCAPIPHVPAAGELVLAKRLQLTLGGCAANVAVDLSKLEVRAAIAGRVGADCFGSIVAELLAESQVDVGGLKVSPERDTSQTLIVNVAGEDRRFIHTFGANADFRAADIPLDLVRCCRVLYVGGFFLMPQLRSEELSEVFRAAREAGVRTVLDVVTPGPGDYLSSLKALLPLVDVFMPNHQEGELITGQRDPVRQAELLHRLGAGTAIVTLGAGGAVAVGKDRRWRADAYPVAMVDGSGGGDAFAAGYIHGLLNGLPTAECLRVASALGASCVQAVGTTTGVLTLAQCQAFLREHPLGIDVIQTERSP
jgi:sugar/nucleoside kinase (ribokinase family)